MPPVHRMERVKLAQEKQRELAERKRHLASSLMEESGSVSGSAQDALASGVPGGAQALGSQGGKADGTAPPRGAAEL